MINTYRETARWSMRSFLDIFTKNNIIVHYMKCRRGDSTGLYYRFYKDFQALVKRVAEEMKECRGVDSDLELCGEELLEFLRKMLTMLHNPNEDIGKPSGSIIERIQQAQSNTNYILGVLSENNIRNK